MRLLSLATLLGLLVVSSGCSDDESDLVGAPLPECPNHDYRPCDTRGAACQARLLSLSACVYGAETVPDVPIHVISEDEFREALEADLEDEQAMRSEAEVAAIEVMESALGALKLVEAGALSDQGQIDSYVENLAGVYLDSASGILLIDHGAPQNDPEAAALLVHESIHALQDADYDLGAWVEPYRDTTDRLLAVRSVTEGQATFYQFRVGLAMTGHAAELVDFEATMLSLASDLDALAQSEASPYVRSAGTFPYGYGGLGAYRGWAADGQGYESSLMESPPLSTQEVLQAAFPDDLPVVVPQEIVQPAATGEYALLDQDVLGGWLLGVLLTKHGVDSETAGAISGEWSGDHLWVYRDAAGSDAWLWELQLASESAAADVTGALEGELPEGVHIEHGGSRLFVASGSDGAPQELLDAGSAFLAGE